MTDQIVLTLGYDIENLTDARISKSYHGEVTTDRYGRKVPKHAHGTENLKRQTSSTKLITDAAMALFDRIMNPKLLVRRVTLVANHLIPEDEAKEASIESFQQMDLFTDYAALEAEQKKEDAALERERRMQKAVLSLKKKFGKNVVLKGMNLQEGATTISRNGQIGGHKAK